MTFYHSKTVKFKNKYKLKRKKKSQNKWILKNHLKEMIIIIKEIFLE